MRRIALILAIFAGSAGFASTVVAGEETHTYKLEIFNAFGLVEGAEVKVASVTAGTVEKLEISEDKTALITVELTGPLAVLGDESECSSEPQSLIAEYFIDCLPKGAPLEDGETLKNKVEQTVQNDLVLNTLRLPFKQRLALLINEFGTALAGNPENLNEAIRLGAPALEDLHDALKLLARQNTVIRDLNVNSDKIVGKLTERRGDVVAFIKEAGDAAVASADRRDDLSTNFDLLDNFLAELEPTMVELENVARQSTPLLSDLRAAAPQLNELAVSLPGFNRATQASLVSLGRAAEPGTRALKLGVRNGTFKALADSARNAPRTGELLADFLRDLDDPSRIVEVDDRAARSCSDKTDPCYSTGRAGPTGYTGLEGLLNYAYYQAASTNQYDELGHLLHFSLYDVFTGPCGSYNAQQSFPKQGGGRTNVLTEADRCVSGLGPNQPGITAGQDESDLGIGPYDSSVCPMGSTDEDICDPTPRAQGGSPTTSRNRSGGGGNGGGSNNGGGGNGGGGNSSGPSTPNVPNVPGNPGGLNDLLGTPNKQLDGLGKKGGRGGKKSGGKNANQAAQDLLDFLFAP